LKLKQLNIAEDYWLRKLEAISSQTVLLSRNLSASEDPLRFYSTTTSENLSATIDYTTGKNEVSRFILFLTTLKILIYKYSVVDEITIGTPTLRFDEVDPEISDVILFFSSVLDPAITSRKIISQTLAELNENTQHQYYDFQSLETRFINRQDKSSSATSPFPTSVGFNYKTLNDPSSHLDRLRFVFEIIKQQNQYQLIIQAYSSKYENEILQSMTDHYINILTEILLKPDAPVSKIQMLTVADREMLISRFNETDKSPQLPGKTIDEVFSKVAASMPDQVALIYEEQYLTYRILDLWSNQVANYLTNVCSIRKEALVGVMINRSSLMVVSLLGILKARAAFVPIDTELPVNRKEIILKTASIATVLTETEFMFEIPSFDGQVVAIDVQLEGVSGHTTGHGGKPQDLAYTLFTSGTSGEPKGCMISHGNLLNYLDWASIFYFKNTTGNFPFFTPLTVDLTLTSIFCPLVRGKAICIYSRHAEITDILKDCIGPGSPVDSIKLTPTHIKLIEDFIPITSPVKMVIVGGEQLTPKHVDIVRNLNSQIKLFNEYGPTESTIGCIVAPIYLTSTQEILIGRPIANMKAFVLGKDGNSVPFDIPGELYLSGSGVGRGYLNDLELTDAKFIRPGIISSQSLYKTGDIAQVNSQGEIKYLGRIDDQLKFNGYRIESGEIEKCLLKYPGIRNAWILKKPGPPLLLCAYYMADNNPAEHKLRAFLLENLPSYMIPHEFIPVATLPLGRGGKIDKKKLLDIGAVEARSIPFRPPGSAIEEQLTIIWSAVLQKENIGIDDNFFSLGGDSLRGIRILNKIKEQLNEIVHVTALFSFPTIALLSKEICKNRNPNHQKIKAERIQEFKNLIPKVSLSWERSSQNPKVIFILSPPRSGSTLLRVILAGHPNLFAPPELELLGYNSLSERSAALGKKLNFFTEGAIRAVKEIFSWGTEKTIAKIKSMEESGMTIKEFYTFLQTSIEPLTLVEKSPSYSLDLNILRRAEQYFSQTHYIHLVRNPNAMIRSFETAKLDQIFKYENDFTTRELAELEWLVSHQNILEFLKDIPENRKNIVRFEKLVSYPLQTAQGICSNLGISFQSKMLDIYGQGSFRMIDGIYPESKMIGDVKFLTHSSINKKTANDWKKYYSEDFICDESVEIAKKLGYRGEDLSNVKKMPLIPVAQQKPYYSLTSAQKSVWIIEQMDEQRMVQNIPYAYVFEGALDKDVFKTTLETLVSRHESLRTTIHLIDEEPVQIINSIDQTNFNVQFSSINGEDYLTNIELIKNKEATTPFNLEVGPLLRCRIISIEEQRHVFLFTIHHLVADGWSINVLFKEIVILYNNFLEGKHNPLPNLRIQYKDFSEWLNSRSIESQMENHRQYWRTVFNPPLPVLNLRKAENLENKRYRGSRSQFNFDLNLSEQIFQVMDREQTTLFMVMVTAVNVLLHYHSGQRDIIVGSPVSCRDQQELENQIGLYINTIAIRNKLNPNNTFLHFLHQVKTRIEEAYLHKIYLFELIIDQLKAEGHLTKLSLFQVLVMIQNDELAGNQDQRLNGIQIHELKFNSPVSKFDLTFSFRIINKRIYGEIEYNTGAFNETLVEKFKNTLIKILRLGTDRHEVKIADLGIAYSRDSETSSLYSNFIKPVDEI